MDEHQPLPPDLFRREDESPDPQFYVEPRFTVHIDDAAIAAVTAHRICRGTAERLPHEPEFDARGLRMEMLY